MSARHPHLRSLLPAALLLPLIAACQVGEPATAGEAPAGAELRANPAGDPVAFVNVSVVGTEREQVTPGQTVVVRDGRIVRIGPRGEVRIPEGALEVDGTGRYLVPGMSEMHGHLPAGAPTDQNVQDILFLYVANGVTLVRGMQGHPAQLRIREAIEGGEILGPRLILASPAMGWGGTPEREEVRARVREFAAQGFDLIKIGEGPDPETYRALVEAGREAGLPVAGHVPDRVGLHGALEAGQVTIDHLDNYVEELIPEPRRGQLAPLWGVASAAHHAREERIPELVEATVAAGVAQVPTMVLWEVFFGDRPPEEIRERVPEVRYMPRQLVDAWVTSLGNLRSTIGHPEGAARVVELRRRIFQALHQGGAEFLMGTDSPQLFSVPGFQNQREMALWVELGMSPFEVIRTGSWNVAAHLDELDEAGSVAEGKRADLILLEGNPMDDIGQMARRVGVMVQGRWIPEEEIRRRLDEMARRHGHGGS